MSFLKGNESLSRLVTQLDSDRSFCPNTGAKDVDVVTPEKTGCLLVKVG